MAAANPGTLRRAAEQLQKRFAAIQKEQDDFYETERQNAAKYFPPDLSRPTSAGEEPLKDLILHEDHLELLGVERSCTMGQLAEAVVAALNPEGGSSSLQGLPKSAYVKFYHTRHTATWRTT